MRKLAVVAMLLGIGLMLAVVLHAGAGRVFDAMARIGAGFALLIPIRLALITQMGAGWKVLGDRVEAPSLGAFAWGRLLRDSASECLPLSQVGGFVVGARALVVAGVSAPFASASTIVDVTLELVAQLLYLLLGLALLRHLRPAVPMLDPLAFAAVALGIGAGAFLALQARGTRLVSRLAARLPRRWSGARAGMEATLASVAAIHARRGRIAAGTLIHLLAWLCNGAEAWLILAMLGARTSLEAAIVIDSLLYGLRSFAFVVPNAFGVQEAGYVMLGGLFGVPPQLCLALSLLRRARDLVVGLPALGAWQLVEGRRAWRLARLPAAGPVGYGPAP